MSRRTTTMPINPFFNGYRYYGSKAQRTLGSAYYWAPYEYIQCLNDSQVVDVINQAIWNEDYTKEVMSALEEAEGKAAGTDAEVMKPTVVQKVDTDFSKDARHHISPPPPPPIVNRPSSTSPARALIDVVATTKRKYVSDDLTELRQQHAPVHYPYTARDESTRRKRQRIGQSPLRTISIPAIIITAPEAEAELSIPYPTPDYTPPLSSPPNARTGLFEYPWDYPNRGEGSTAVQGRAYKVAATITADAKLQNGKPKKTPHSDGQYGAYTTVYTVEDALHVASNFKKDEVKMGLLSKDVEEK